MDFLQSILLRTLTLLLTVTHCNPLWVQIPHTKNARFLSWIHTNLTEIHTVFEPFQIKIWNIIPDIMAVCHNLLHESHICLVLEHIIFCTYCNIIVNIQWMWMAAAAISCSSVTTLYNRRHPMASTLLYEPR